MALLFWFAPVFARAAEEAALLELWQQHLAAPENHEMLLKACRAFTTAYPADPLLPVVHGLETWHWFRAGRTTEAVNMSEPYLSAASGPVNDGGKRLALGWLTRLDRERVASSLQIYYRKEIAFPKSLEQLVNSPKIPAEARPPMIDRFGKPWVYSLVGLAKIPGFQDQKYSLQSSVLGDVSDFKTALKLAYAERITATPAQVLAGPNGSTMVKFAFEGNKRAPATIASGQAVGDLYLAFVGAKIIVVCDFTHWKVFPRP